MSQSLASESVFNVLGFRKDDKKVLVVDGWRFIVMFWGVPAFSVCAIFIWDF